LQNKAKVKIGKMNINIAALRIMAKTMNNQQRTLLKTKPNKAKVKIGKMDISIAVIKDYDKYNEQSTTNVIQNKANQTGQERLQFQCKSAILVSRKAQQCGHVLIDRQF